MLTEAYQDPYGLWEVSTDCDEGNRTKVLGIYEGFIDEIALSIPPNRIGYGGLTFTALVIIRKEDSEDGFAPLQNKVVVSLAANSGTWSGSCEDRAHVIGDLFAGRPVDIRAGGVSFSGFIIAAKHPQDAEELERQRIRREALAKLTPDEIEALGLQFRATGVSM